MTSEYRAGSTDGGGSYHFAVILCHAAWLARGELFVWGEDENAPPRADDGGAHPFAARAADLRRALGVKGRQRDVKLVLPSTTRSPVPSRRAGRPLRTKLHKRAWNVRGLALSGAEAIDLLLEPPDAPVSDSMLWLTRVAETGLALVASGRVLPALEAGRARWVPAPGPAETGRIRRLTAAMPPACRAEEGSRAKDVLDGALGAAVDVLARRAVGAAPPAPPRARATAAEAFVHALRDGDDVAGEPGELAKLERALEEWRRGAERPAGPLRTCFKLVPPQKAGRTWLVELVLQSEVDPSLMVGASEVWSAPRTLTFLEQTLENPQERLLEDLGRALRLWPGLEEALSSARPTEVHLDDAGAVRFVTEIAPLLEQAGFGVVVPSRPARLGVRIKARPKERDAYPSGLLGKEALCDYRYEVALGDEKLSVAELRELARLKMPLVKVRGQWVVLGPRDIESALALLEREDADGGTMPGAELLRLGLGLADAPGGLPVESVEGEGWIGRLLDAGEDLRAEAVPTPAGFKGELRPYQERGLGWLVFLDTVGLGACLADDMGLGKTLELLALLVHEERTQPTLVVCPMSVVGNWQREAERFAPGLRVHVHHGTERKAALERAAGEADLVLTTYGLLARDRDLLAGVRWGRVVLDEAQNVKNPSSKQAQAARTIPAGRRIAMTGTPVENRLTDLWSIMEFCNPGLLGSRDSFRERFVVPIERWGDEDAAALLRRMTRPFVLRRLKTDRTIIADLPEKMEMPALCNLTREQATLYQAVVDEMLERIEQSEGIERKGLVLATMTRLKQVCNHPAHYLADGSQLPGRSGKLNRLEELLEEIAASGERALVFTQFAEMGHLLKARFGEDVPFLYGGVRKAARDEMIARFQSGDGPPLMLLSLKAGGVGLNLTAASHVVHFDRWWNPAVEDQATDRAFRIGQRRRVQVRKFVCVGTLEERIDQLIEQKRDLAERIVGSGEGWLTELGTEELRELVALGSDAVAEG